MGSDSCERYGGNRQTMPARSRCSKRYQANTFHWTVFSFQAPPPYGFYARHKCFVLKGFCLNRINIIRAVSPPTDFVLCISVSCRKASSLLAQVGAITYFGSTQLLTSKCWAYRMPPLYWVGAAVTPTSLSHPSGTGTRYAV